MARKTKSILENQLLLPSLALSLLVFFLVIFVVNIPKPTPQRQVSAKQEQVLTNGLDSNSLETDLLLLESEEFQDLEQLFAQ